MEQKIIVWDFSGIQGYLFDIRKNKSATKRLKWRSVFIEMLLEKIMQDLMEKLGKENFVNEKEEKEKPYLVSWWKFILICKNFDKDKFNEFKKDIENKLFKQFYWELKIIFWLADFEDNFKNALNQVYEKVEQNKLKVFNNILQENWQWKDEMFVFGNWEKNEKWNNIDNWFEKDRWPSNVCKFSKWDLIKIRKSDDNIDWYLKNILEEEDVGWFWLNTANDIIISNFVADNKWWNNKIEIFEEKIEIDKKYKSFLPKNNDWKIKSFEDLAWESWFNKLAVLKWDIDNLGEIFQFWLKWWDSETSSEWQIINLKRQYKENYKKISVILDNFWKKELYDFIDSNDKYKNNLYVVYAGWDDFILLGKWDLIIEFYKELLQKFEKYLQNRWIDEILDWKTYKDIHFSGAINLFWPHDTFFTIVKQTENLLEEAKNKDVDKNQVNIFGQVIKNDDFRNLFEEAKKFKKEFLDSETILKQVQHKGSEWQKKDIVSVGTLRFLLDIGKKIKLEKKDENWNKKDFFEYWIWRAELFYHLGRNYWGDIWWWNQKMPDDKRKKIEFRNYINGMLLHNWEEKFKSLVEWNDGLFEKDVWEKLIVMMSYILYQKRS